MQIFRRIWGKGTTQGMPKKCTGFNKLKKQGIFFQNTNQMQFETEEPTHGACSSLGYTFGNLVNMYSLVLADTQWCAVNKTYARAFSQQDLLDKQSEWNDNLSFQFYYTGV